jgi:hypothetical protein
MASAPVQKEYLPNEISNASGRSYPFLQPKDLEIIQIFLNKVKDAGCFEYPRSKPGFMTSMVGGAPKAKDTEYNFEGGDFTPGFATTGFAAGKLEDLLNEATSRPEYKQKLAGFLMKYYSKDTRLGRVLFTGNDASMIKSTPIYPYKFGSNTSSFNLAFLIRNLGLEDNLVGPDQLGGHRRKRSGRKTRSKKGRKTRQNNRRSK